MPLGTSRRNGEGTHQLMFCVEIYVVLGWLFNPEVERACFFETPTRQHNGTSQKIEFFTVTSVKTSNPTASIVSYVKFENEALYVSSLSSFGNSTCTLVEVVFI